MRGLSSHASPTLYAASANCPLIVSPCRPAQVICIVCWPLALFALVLWPVVWLVSIPFRLVGIAFEGVFALLRASLLLPARLLDGPGHTDTARPKTLRTAAPNRAKYAAAATVKYVL